MNWPIQLLLALAYIVSGRWLIRGSKSWMKAAFALLNVAVVFLFFFWTKDSQTELLFKLVFATYLLLIIGQYLTLHWWGERAGWLPWLAFLTPITILVVARYAPLGSIASLLHPAARAAFRDHPNFDLGATFIGLSYLAFRTSHLVLEVRNGVVTRPNFWEYLGFAFFVPTFSVGPISPYSQHRMAFAGTVGIPYGHALMRIVVGAVKFKFLGPLLNQLTYGGLLLDGHPHPWIDLPIAAVAYYLFLYCNFSGFCDIAVGGARLMGVPVAENFANPFAARNVKDFWNRWHITLSQYMRDVVFSPLSKSLVRVFGPANANHAIALSLVVVFLLVGIWHGTGWNYIAFGLLHALGVAANHYYTIGLKKWLGKSGFAAYNQSRLIRIVAMTLTFIFISATVFLFANDWDAMKKIFSALQQH